MPGANGKLHDLDFEQVRLGSRPFLARLSELFSDMDEAYAEVAESVGFVCRGCSHNCCETRFHHHTLLEVFFLFRGFWKLSAETREKIQSIAAIRCLEMEKYDAGNMASPFRGLCPASDGTLCMLYENRPMICRLHGVSWKMRGRNGEVSGPGCDVFEKLKKKKEMVKKTLVPLDRAKFYQPFALLEQEFRKFAHFDGKIGLTISEILCLEGMHGLEGKIS